MTPMVKVGIAAAVGAAAGAFLEPKIKTALPASLTTGENAPTVAKVVHFATIFVSAMGAYWAVSKL